MSFEDELAERIQDYTPARDNEAWVEYIAPMVGILAVGNLPDEHKQKMIDAMFGTMPLLTSLNALATVTALTSDRDPEA